MQMREKVGKSRNTVFFQWFEDPEGRKVGSLKRRVRSQLARWEMKNCTPLWPEAHFQDKMCKTHQRRTTFGSCDVEKVHAVVARSTVSDHFWKLRCRKSARRCGAKHISKSTCLKTPRVRTTFGGSDVEKVHAIVARSTFRSQNVKSTRGSLRFASLHYTTLHYTTLHCTTLHYITLRYTTFHYTSLHYTTLHSTTLHSTRLQLQLELHNYTPLHSTTLNYTTLHYITLHYTTFHYTRLHYITLHYITLNDTAPQIDR